MIRTRAPLRKCPTFIGTQRRHRFVNAAAGNAAAGPEKYDGTLRAVAVTRAAMPGGAMTAGRHDNS